MDRENPIASAKRRYKNFIWAALEICDEKRAQESGFEPDPESSGQRRNIDRAAAIIEAAAAKLAGNDVTALEAVCASQALALDVIFNQFARDSAKLKALSHPAMKMALRAQSQCRATLKTLAALRAPQRAQKEFENSAKRTIENGNTPR